MGSLQWSRDTGLLLSLARALELPRVVLIPPEITRGLDRAFGFRSSCCVCRRRRRRRRPWRWWRRRRRWRRGGAGDRPGSTEPGTACLRADEARASGRDGEKRCGPPHPPYPNPLPSLRQPARLTHRLLQPPGETLRPRPPASLATRLPPGVRASGSLSPGSGLGCRSLPPPREPAGSLRRRRREPAGSPPAPGSPVRARQTDCWVSPLPPSRSLPPPSLSERLCWILLLGSPPRARSFLRERLPDPPPPPPAGEAAGSLRWGPCQRDADPPPPPPPRDCSGSAAPWSEKLGGILLPGAPCETPDSPPWLRDAPPCGLRTHQDTHTITHLDQLQIQACVGFAATRKSKLVLRHTRAKI
ncbi:basic proline-rich protein-like [Calypte anna]|uniref:basic proline-rich protein-like n=1 Tax=Calypte anna TaxID=9244 RepID=UPI0011C40015|nr:basic proline-rich protein-like [Calypte anna]